MMTQNAKPATSVSKYSGTSDSCLNDSKDSEIDKNTILQFEKKGIWFSGRVCTFPMHPLNYATEQLTV